MGLKKKSILIQSELWWRWLRAVLNVSSVADMLRVDTCDPLVFKDVPVDALYYLLMDRLIHYQPSCGASEILVLGQLCVQRHHSGQWAIAGEWQARKMSPLFRLYKWRLATITHNWTLHFKSGASWPVKSYYTIFFICGPWFW